MQKSKIEVGVTYQVEVDGLNAPGNIEERKYGDGSGTPAFAHGWTPFAHGWTPRGVSKRWGTRVYATVTALDQPRPVSTGAWSRYYSFPSDGVLVTFEEPVEVGAYGSKTKVKTAVLSTRHIIALKSTVEARKVASEQHKAAAQAKADEDAVAFLAEVDAVANALIARGFKGVEVCANQSGLRFDGGSLSMDTAEGTDGQRRAVRWSFGWSMIDTRVFVKMLLA